MNLSQTFLQRPVATALLTAGVALAGIFSYSLLPAAPLPRVDFPTIQVSAALPGASPETMATSVAAPLERQFGQIAGVSEMTSTSLLGQTSVVLQFDLSRNIDGAARDVQAAIAAARTYLPPNLPAAPTYRKVNPAETPIIILALTSDTLTTAQMYDAASSVLAQSLAQVEGVGQVAVSGASLPAVRIELNPAQLAGYGVALEDVRAAVAASSVKGPKGQLAGSGTAWQIEANDQLATASGYRPIVVAYRQGAPVALGDVAQVQDSQEDLRNIGLVNGKPCVLVVVFRQPGANIIATVDRVRELLPRLSASVSHAIDLSVVLDRTPVIRASLSDARRTLVLSSLLVVLVVLLFLRSVRATLIPAVVVPVSLIGTLGFMYLLDYSLDNLSLMALTIATGFVVDDAIVVIENTSRHLEQGTPAREAAAQGAREIGFTVLSMSVSLVAVFLPILLMGGILGRVFREFAVTLSVAILISLVLSLTTTPVMCAALLRPQREERHGWLFRGSERAFDWLHGHYQRSLSWTLAHPAGMLVLTLGTIIASVFLYRALPKGYFPQQDTGRLSGSIQGDQDSSFSTMTARLAAVNRIISADPAVEYVLGFVGSSGGGASTARNTARIFVALTPLAKRKVSTDQVIARLRKPLSQVPGAPTVLQGTQDLRVGAVSSAAQFQFVLRSEDLSTLAVWAPQVEQRLRASPMLADVTSDFQVKGLQTLLAIDRDAASRLGITTRMIDDTLYDAFGQRQVSVIYSPMNQYHVVMEAAPSFWQSPEGLDDLLVVTAAGDRVPLPTIATARTEATTLSISHRAQAPSVTISFNLPEGVSLGQASDGILASMREMGLPRAITTRFSGTAAAFQESLSSEPVLILAAILAVFVVLGVLYESYVHPITILSTLPSAGLGALLALTVTGTELSIVALIGIILLIGIVKKNGIMMVDFALDAERRHGMTSLEAIRSASLIRFRPILMTTLAALLGAIPLAVGRGVGAEVRRPLGIAIVGGLLVSQLLTLYTTPVIYLALDRLRLRLSRKGS